MTASVASGLGDDGRRGRPGAVALELQRLQALVRGLLPAGAHLPPEVQGVDREEDEAEPRLDGEGDQAEPDLDREDREEPRLVAGQPRRVDTGQVVVTGQVVTAVVGRQGERAAAGAVGAGAVRADAVRRGSPRATRGRGRGEGGPLPALAPDEHAAGDAVGDGADHERAAHRGADGDVVAVLGAAEQHRDQGHHALGQRRAGGGQDGAHGDRSDLEADAEPLDGVDEPLTGDVDGDGAREQQQDVEHEEVGPLCRAAGKVSAPRGWQTSTHGSVWTADSGSKVSPTPHPQVSGPVTGETSSQHVDQPASEGYSPSTGANPTHAPAAESNRRVSGRRSWASRPAGRVR